MGYAMPGAPAAAPTKRRGLLMVLLGAALLVVGVVLYVLAGMRLSDGITSLAPAPAGCETSLEFDSGGTYTFFVETKGAIDAIDGDCNSGEREYEYEGDATPRVRLTLLDESGDEVDLDRVEGPTYDGGGRSGEGVRTADIDEGGTYTLSVDTNEPDVVVRVGKDPNRGVATMRTLGLVLGVLGAVLAALGFVLGRRRPAAAAPAGPTPTWQPGGGPPPVAPPPDHIPTQPPYGGPPSGPYGSGGQWGSQGPASAPPGQQPWGQPRPQPQPQPQPWGQQQQPWGPQPGSDRPNPPGR